MNVKIISMTEKPIEVIYRAYKTCVSVCNPTEIEIPKKPFYPVDAIEPLCMTNDNKAMIELIKRHINHESVLEHCNITFAIEGVSRSLLAQLTRHRLCSFSVQSQRYCNMENSEFVIPDAIKNNPEMLEEFTDHIEDTKLRYKRFIDHGIAKEDARAILANACTTNIIMTANLRNLRHIYSERSCKYAQEEIRTLANEMMKLTKAIIPFADYKAKKCGISCFECKAGE